MAEAAAPAAGSEHSPSTITFNGNAATSYDNTNGDGMAGNEEILHDPSLDFCNAFWGPDNRGYEVITTRLSGAAATIEELRLFWKERAALEEEYAKRLSKLAKMPIGKVEIGDLAEALKSVQAETAAQASYHLQLSAELHTTIEQPTAEFANRLNTLKKGLQDSVDKSYRKKGLQEGHVAKARDRYKNDCLKLNQFVADMQLHQGAAIDKYQSKIDKVRSSISINEQDLRDYVRVYGSTNMEWENEWRTFLDHVQDIEEDRLILTKDLVWAYANAVSQVCVEDDSSCERIRERLETFEPANDMANFARGWGTGDTIPDGPVFVNYAAGEDDNTHPATFHRANFRRLSNKPVMPLSQRQSGAEDEFQQQQQQIEERNVPPPEPKDPTPPPPAPKDPVTDGVRGMSLHDNPVSEVSTSSTAPSKPPVGGVALPGLAHNFADSGAPPVANRGPPTPGPPSPSARDVNDETDPVALALAELRRDPLASSKVRRNQSQRRGDSLYSVTGSMRSNTTVPNQSQPRGDSLYSATGSMPNNTVPVGGSASVVGRAPSPSPSTNRTSGASYQGHHARGSTDSSLVPPAPGHTAAALAQSMADFERRSGSANRGSVNYQSVGDSIVGSHPSRPTSPAGSATGGRVPSPAMMAPPTQPGGHIAETVVGQYGQAFPGERSRSRPTSVYSNRSRANSFNEQADSQQQQQQQLPVSSRTGFVGIGAGGPGGPPRSPSPAPPAASSSNAPGGLGPQNLGISLDQHGGVAHDSMAEAYRRQYQQDQQQRQKSPSIAAPRTPQQPPYQDPQQPPYQDTRQDPRMSPYQAPSPPAQSPPAQFSAAPGGYQQQQVPPHQFPGHQQSFDSQSQHQRPYDAPPQPQPQQSYDSSSRHPSIDSQAARHSYDSRYQPQEGPVPEQSPYPQQYGGYSHPPPQPANQQSPQNQFGYGGQPHYPQQTQPPAAPYNPSGYQAGLPPSQPQSTYNQNRNGYHHDSQSQPQPHQGGYDGYRPNDPYRPVSPGGPAGVPPTHRTPSPQPMHTPDASRPTEEWGGSNTGSAPTLFYVKALYDYTAQSAAEFDFQAGDIIAVTSTPEDGWWSGELLDEARREPGRVDFPSNFVTLF